MIAEFPNFSLEMSEEQALSASHPGSCDADIAKLVRNPKIQKQLRAIPDSDLVDALRETGGWDDDELQDRQANEERIIWLAAGDIAEGL